MIATRYNGGIDLSNSTDIVADSISIIEDNKIVNIKNRLVNWVSGDSTGKNVISTGDGLLTVSYPDGAGTALVINGPLVGDRAGQATFYEKVNMWKELAVDGSITSKGLVVLTTGTGYTRTEINNKFSRLNGTGGDIGTVEVSDENLLITPKADKADVYDKTEIEALLGQRAPKFNTITPLEQHINSETGETELSLSTTLGELIHTKADSTYVDEELAKKANDESTYSKTQIDSFFIRNDPYLVKAPLQKAMVIDPDRSAGNKVQLQVDFSELSLPLSKAQTG
jgi:hypothetical protein